MVVALHSNAAASPVDSLLHILNGRMRVSLQRYNGTELLGSEKLSPFEITSTPGARWQMSMYTENVPGQTGVIDIRTSIKLVEGKATATAISTAFDFSGWNPQNYVMVPAIVYNGNRYAVLGNGYNPSYTKEMYYNPKLPLTISNNPRLALEAGVVSEISLQSTNASTPAMCFFSSEAKKGFIVLTSQESWFGNNGLGIKENEKRDSCTFSITTPAMRKMAAGFGDFHASGDKAPDWNQGDSVSLAYRLYVFDATDIPSLLKKFMLVRKEFTGPNNPRNQLPMSKELEWGAAICSNNWVSVSAGSYYRPENNDHFQLGWVSGMMNTYPMLALDNLKERQRVAEELNFVVSKLQGKSGYFYGGITAEGVLRPEKMHPDFPAVQAMVRKNGDVLFWLMKHLLLFRQQQHAGDINPSWEVAAKKLALAFVRTWKEHGEFGQYIVPESGEVAVFNSTAGALVPAGLAIAADYFRQPEWLQVAKGAAAFYYKRDVAGQGLTGGDCGDISQDANSESAFAFLESLVALFHYTGDKQWLLKAEVQAALCATWTISYDPVFPPKSDIGRLDCRMAGAIWASIQNKHAAPGICTSSGDYLFKLFRATGDRGYADLLRDIQHAHAEAVNRPGHITTNNLVGSSMERIQPSDAEGRSSVGNFINTRNSWTETNGMLMALEVPGIYLQVDTKQLYVFDHVEAAIIPKDGSGISLLIENKTKYPANVSVFAETKAASARTLGYISFPKWPKVHLEPGEKKMVRVSGEGKVIELAGLR